MNRFGLQQRIGLFLTGLFFGCLSGGVGLAGESIWERYGEERNPAEPGYQPAGVRICIVADPSDTPLNVRATPGGKIIGSLPDGAEVEWLERSDHNKNWVYIYTPVMEGYVWANYLRC